MSAEFKCKSPENNIPYPTIGDTAPEACASINPDSLRNLTLYSAIIGIFLFFIHIGYTYIKCKKFSSNSGALLLITFVFIITSFIIFVLSAKIDSVNPASSDKDYDKGDYLTEPGTVRNLLSIQVIGNIIFLGALIFIAVKNKSMLIGCDDQFPWITVGILVTTEALMLLYGLLKLV